MRTRNDVIEVRLAGLMARQMQAIRRGELVALAPLAAEMAELMEALTIAPGGMGAPGLRRLRQRAAENQRLLDAARRGVQAARGRLNAIIGAGTELKTYDSQGRTASVAFGTGSVERRA